MRDVDLLAFKITTCGPDVDVCCMQDERRTATILTWVRLFGADGARKLYKFACACSVRSTAAVPTNAPVSIARPQTAVMATVPPPRPEIK